jgi:sugar lactone lactonase YvrE
MDRWMSTSMQSVAVACAAVLALAGAAAADGHVRTVVEFDAEQGEFPEGVAVTRLGDVYTGLTQQGRLMKIPSGEGAAEEFAVVELSEGDFGLVGQAVEEGGWVYSAVVSADPEVHGVFSFDPANGEALHVEGTEVIGMPNAIVFEDDVMYVSDTITGAVWRSQWVGFQGWTPAELWVADPLLEGTGELPFPFPIGANGIVVDDGVVYVGVTEQSHIVGIPVGADGAAGEPFVHLDLPGVAVDGIAITDDGDFLIADPPANTIWRVGDDGQPEAIADADDGISGPTSVFYEKNLDRQPVYVANAAQSVLGELAPHGPSIMAITLD